MARLGRGWLCMLWDILCMLMHGNLLHQDGHCQCAGPQMRSNVQCPHKSAHSLGRMRALTVRAGRSAMPVGNTDAPSIARRAAANRDVNAAGWMRAIRELVVILCVAAPVAALDTFLTERMIVRWA